MKQSEIGWSRKFFAAMNLNAIWGVPRSGLVFEKRDAETLNLKEVMPFNEAMPLLRKELIAYQQSDFECIKKRFSAAGVKVTSSVVW